MNNSDLIILVLGNRGKKEWLRSEILDILSDELRIEKLEANSRFINVTSRTDYFEKVSDSPVKYQFTKIGKVRYEELKKAEKSDEKFEGLVEDFIKKYYWDEFSNCLLEEREFIEIDFKNIENGLYYVAEQLYKRPDEILVKFNKALEKIFVPADIDHRPKASIINAGGLHQVEDIKTEHIGKFVQVEGRVVVQSLPRSQVMRAAYKCQRCGHVTELYQEPMRLVEPFICENDACERKGPFVLLPPPESEYVDAQEITIESLRGGQVTMKVHLAGSLCRPPWERDAKVVRVCGIVRAYNSFSKTGTKTNVFEWVIDANSIKFADDSNTEPPTEEEIKLFEEWSKNPYELRTKLLESVAPNIYSMLDVKDACSLSLFSDWTWGLDPRDVLERSSIHILLFGDPGVAKSQIIKDVVFLAPKGKFGQVTNMTRGGLSTAAVEENGEWCVKSGFFSQADQGVAGLDEIDKVQKKEDLNCLVSVLNDQIQLVSKIGKNDIPFNTRTAVLGAANPKGGHLRQEEIMNHIEETIPSYIFQRFDLIFAIRDVPDLEKDGIVADNINLIHNNSKINRKNIERVVSPELYRKYVLYARTKPVPVFESGAQKLIKEYYLTLRKKSTNYPVIGARQVNVLNRFARAVARREMASKVTEEHVKYAIGLMKAALSTLSDEDDYGMYNYGRTKSQAEKVKLIRDAIKEICKTEKKATIDIIAFNTGLDTIEVEHTIVLMEKNREVYKVKDGYRV